MPIRRHSSFCNMRNRYLFRPSDGSILPDSSEKGCNSNFLEDLKLAIEDFKAFQCEEPEKVKIPD